MREIERRAETQHKRLGTGKKEQEHAMHESKIKSIIGRNPIQPNNTHIV